MFGNQNDVEATWDMMPTPSTALRQTCPACGNPLRAIVEDGTTFVYCGVGRCPSPKAGDGIKGCEDVEILAARLAAIIEDERGWE